MAELLRTKEKEEELTTADLASYGIAQKQPDVPKLVKGQETETPSESLASLPSLVVLTQLRRRLGPQPA
jgi:hypothetical protein